MDEENISDGLCKSNQFELIREIADKVQGNDFSNDVNSPSQIVYQRPKTNTDLDVKSYEGEFDNMKVIEVIQKTSEIG